MKFTIAHRQYPSIEHNEKFRTDEVEQLRRRNKILEQENRILTARVEVLRKVVKKHSWEAIR